MNTMAFDNFHLENGTVLSCERIDTGTFQVNENMTLTGLPPFYRVCANLTPTPSSTVNIELWLPTPEEWNGRFLGTGNAGGGGNIYYYQLRYGLMRGFAAGNVDLGTSPNADAAAGFIEKQNDFGNRGTHVMTVAAKSIIEQFYGRPASYSYFSGGSTGGQQALVEAQRYPEDYNGIIAGCPGSNRTHLHAQFIWNLQAAKTDDGKLMFTQEELDKITARVVERYAALSGGAPGDNFLTDPRRVKVDVDIFNGLGLSTAQVEALRKIYAGPVNPRTGKRIFSGIVPGSECHTGGLAWGQDPGFWMGVIGFPFRWVFGSDFDYQSFDFDGDMDKVDEQLAQVVNANASDLSAFKNCGGKLLMYTGSTDTQVATFDTIQYYERVIDHEGGLEKTREFARLFLVPGLGHMQAGPGINDIGQVVSSPEVEQDAEHSIINALMEWVENGRVPEKIIGTAYQNVNPFSGDGSGIRFQRPVYPYPLFPKYTGGDVNSPDSYAPEAHERGAGQPSDELYFDR